MKVYCVLDGRRRIIPVLNGRIKREEVMKLCMPYANIYGHVHSNPSYVDCSAQSFCVSVERINYTPIEFGEIVNRMEQAK